MIGLLRWLLATLAVALCASAQAGEMRALLVGVSEYPGLEKSFQLQGPRNDVERMRRLLLQRGFPAANVAVLADGVAASTALPTRANVLQGLDALATRAKKGDYVFLYFAGHGSQEPADRTTPEGRDESDGLFEVFLPRDVVQWTQPEDGSLTHIPNGIIDYEIRQRVDRITGQGAFVWGVFDACHSATLVRGVGDDPEVRTREVTPAVLGISRAAMEASARAAAAVPEASRAARPDAGGSVFFYAAQTTESALEMRLPEGHPERQHYGLFGFMIAQGLDAGVPMTYRQLAQYVLNQYGAMNQARHVTPLFSGTNLDAAVFGQETLPLQQWKIDKGGSATISAGALSRLDDGALFAIVASPLDDVKSALGYAEARGVGLAASTLVPVAQGGKPAIALGDVPAGAYARLVRLTAQYELRVAVDLSECKGECPARRVIDPLRAAGADAVEGLRVKWVDAGQTADVALKVRADRVLLVPPSLQGLHCDTRTQAADRARCEGELAAGALVLAWTPAQPADALAAQLSQALHGIGRATNLMRIAARLTTGGAGSKLVTRVTHTPASARRAGAQRATATPFSGEDVLSLHDGDRVDLALRNEGRVPVDVTVLYIDADYGVSVLFPQSGASNRLEPGASEPVLIDINDTTTGVERLVVIAVDALPHSERADFSFLAQPPVAAMQAQRARGVGAAADDDSLDAFRDAGFAEFKTRDAMTPPRLPSARTSMQVFNWNVER